ncbi:MAG: hypothetical protein IKB86_01595 [Clostridia bacterium]|nr:hypothetical protein [Clostridia bacterium]
MLKKILTIASAMFLGLNFGFISGLAPIYLVVTMVLFPKDPLNANILAACSLITSVISGIFTYIYAYKKKREHEDKNLFGFTLAVTFTVCALIMAIVLFIYAGNEQYRI